MADDSVIAHALLGILAGGQSYSAATLAESAANAGLEVTKTDVNRVLYNLRTRGLVSLTTIQGGLKPLRAQATAGTNETPLQDRLYRMVVADPTSKVYLAELVADLLEEFGHSKAQAVRLIANALNKKTISN